MSEQLKDGGPAFGQFSAKPVKGGVMVYQSSGGMSLRDWFAGQALAGMLADPGVRGPDIAEAAASDAYTFADAMLEARK